MEGVEKEKGLLVVCVDSVLRMLCTIIPFGCFKQSPQREYSRSNRL